MPNLHIRNISLIFIAFAVSVFIRLPNLNRPLANHHEYNTAVILMNIESWRDAGGGNVFNYIPVLNYQHPGDKLPALAGKPNFDASGNSLYLSFGAGWYLLPYTVYQIFQLQPLPEYLKIINLIFNFLTVLLLYFFVLGLLGSLQSGKKIALTVCIGFLFSPGLLWYLGNGYVTTGIMLPFLCIALMLMFPNSSSLKHLTFSRTLLLFILIVILVYFDWFILFLIAVYGIYLLLENGVYNKNVFRISAIAVAGVTGIAIILLQYASYIGWHNTYAVMFQRFLDRSILEEDVSFGRKLLVMCRHIATMYAPLLLAAFIALIFIRIKRIDFSFQNREKKFLTVYIIALILYNLTFAQWSYQHEFALIPAGIAITYVCGRLIAAVPVNKFYPIIIACLLLSVTQYYFINRPGKLSMDGTPYTKYQQLGNALQTLPKDHYLFAHEWTAEVQYYADRSIFPVENIDTAKVRMREWKIDKALWIETNQFKLLRIDTLK